MVTVGSPAINRVSSTQGTLIEKLNAADGNGTIVSVEMYVAIALVNCEVAIFEEVSANRFTTRDDVAIGAVSTGFQTFSGLSLDVETGDFIGIYFSGGELDRDLKLEGPAGYWFDGDDQIPCTNELFGITGTGGMLSLFGTSVAPITAPVVTTQAATSVEDTTAEGNGTIVDDGGETPSAWGIVWNLTGTPDTGDNVVAGSGAGAEAPFTAAMTGLPTGDTIYVRAYITNSHSTTYGGEVSFLTKPAAPTNVAATDGTDTAKVVVTWTKSTGATGYKVYEGANLLDTLGDVATYDDTAAAAPTITPGTASASDGSSPDHVTLSLAGESANVGASRTYKVVALNATGDSEDSDTDTGYRGVGALTYQWQRSAGDADNTFGNIGGGTTDPYNDVGGVITPDGRYYRCLLDATGATQGESTHDRGYMAIDFPTVTTQAATNVEDDTATGNGDITDTGGANPTRRGIVWDLASHGDPGDVSPAVSDYDNDVGTNGDFGTGAFTESLTSLPTGDTIYVRAYALNSEGYSYGGEVSFLTKPAKPTNVAATDGDHTDKVVVTWTKSTGATGYKVYEGANLLDTLGDVATYDDSAAAAPTITPGTASASDGSSPLHVTLSLAGESGNVGASRTYKVVALNATGDSEDSDTDTGYRGVGALTYQWQVENGGWGNIGGATTDPYNDTAAPAPTITPGTASASDGSSPDHVTLSLAGESTSVGASENYRCILSATGAANATSTEDTGYRGVGAITYQWQRSAADSDASFSNIVGGTTDPYNDVGGVAFPDGRYYRCLLDATGAAQGESTHDRGYEDSIIDQIGAILIQRITGFTRQGRRLTIYGDMSNETTMQTLEDLCEDADMGSALHKVPGEQTIGEDLTSGTDFTVICTFEDPSVPDGTYLILSPVRRSEESVTFQSFSLDLFLQ